MASVLAIVSKAVFEKMVSKSVAVGDVVDTDRYASTPVAFSALGDGDWIFLVTVRPPDEALWLVAILDKPQKKGDAWVGTRNTTPIRDITPLVKQLQFSTGKGITSKPGALAMSLQTPRVLTEADVALLRGGAARPAATEYQKQVAATPAGKKAKAQAAAAAASPGGQRLELVNYRRPFEMLKKLAKAQYAQVAQLTANNDAGKPEQCVKDEAWAPMELVDVREVATGKVTHQLYLWPYGSGQLFEADGVNAVATIIQHGFEMDPDEDDIKFRKALAAAYATAEPKLAETVDFRLDWVPTKTPASETEKRAQQKAAMERLEKIVGESKERYRLFEELTQKQQDAIRELYRKLDPYEHFGHLERLGLPPIQSLARWAGIEPPTLLEQRVPNKTRAWPMWKWLKAAQTGAITVDECVRELAKALPASTIADVAWAVCTKELDNGRTSYELWQRELDSDKAMDDAAVGMIRLLAALVDASGDNAAVEFADRTEKHLENEPEFYLGAVATFALVARARRRGESLPKRFYSLAARKAGFLGNGTSLRGAMRDIYEVIPPTDREAFLELDGISCAAIHEEEIRNGRTKEIPVLIHTWLIADLVPTDEVAKAMIEDVARWNNDTQPTAAALEMIQKVGATCIPHIKKALKTTKSKHKGVLEKALKLLSAAEAPKPASKRTRRR